LTDVTLTSMTEIDIADVRLASGPSGQRSWSARQVEIFDQLQDLFLDEGFRHLTIADLVDRLHCSRRTLYSLAPSREELVLIVIDRLLTRMSYDARARAEACAHPGDAIAAYLDTGVTTLRRAQPAFTEDLESYLPTKHLYDRHLGVALDTLGKLVEDGIARGTFRSYHPPLVAEILDASVDRIRRPEVLARAGVSMSQALAELSELIRRGLVKDPDGKGSKSAVRPRAGGSRRTGRHKPAG
jgi:AcrR family transcriptional regulator